MEDLRKATSYRTSNSEDGRAGRDADSDDLYNEADADAVGAPQAQISSVAAPKSPGSWLQRNSGIIASVAGIGLATFLGRKKLPGLGRSIAGTYEARGPVAGVLRGGGGDAIAGRAQSAIGAPVRMKQDELVSVGRAHEPVDTITDFGANRGLADYKGFGYESINNTLRGAKTSTRKIASSIRDIDRAFSKASGLKEEVVLFRGIRGDSAAGNQIMEMIEKGVAKGSVIGDAGFVSTSRKAHDALGFATGSRSMGTMGDGTGILLRIKAGPGTKTVDYWSEGETLLDRGSQFKITGIQNAEISGRRAGLNTNAKAIIVDVDLVPSLRKADDSVAWMAITPDDLRTSSHGKSDTLGQFSGSARVFLARMWKVDAMVDAPPSDREILLFAIRRVAREMKAAADETERFVTAEEGKGGDYRKGRFSWFNLPITIETPAGAFRRGPGWSSEVKAHYGEVEGTIGADGDPVDVFLNPNPECSTCLVIYQCHPHTGEFDEHKVMLGWANAQEALDVYAAAFSDGLGHQRIGGSLEMTLREFGAWLAEDGPRKSARIQKRLYALKMRRDPDQTEERDVGSAALVVRRAMALRKMLKFDESRVRRDERGRFANKVGYVGASAIGGALAGAYLGSTIHGAMVGGWRGTLTAKGAIAGGKIGAAVGAASAIGLQVARHLQYGRDLEGGYPKVAEIKRTLLRHGKEHDRERAVITGDGQVLADRLGDEGSVAPQGIAQIPAVALSMGRGGIVRTYHNHPGDNSFNTPSPPDLDFALGHARASRREVVYAQSGATYRFLANRRLSDQDVDRVVSAHRTATLMPALLRGAAGNVPWWRVSHEKYRKAFPDEKHPGHIVMMARSHGAMLGLADRGIISYNFRFSEKEKRALAVIEKEINAVRSSVANDSSLPRFARFEMFGADGKVVSQKIVKRPLSKFDESKIRRDDDGRFTFKDAVGAALVGGAAAVAAREGVKAKLASDRRAFSKEMRDFYGRYPERGGKPVFRGAPKLDPNPTARVYDAVFVTSGRSHAQQYAGDKGAISSYILDRRANFADVASPAHRAMSAVNVAAEHIGAGMDPRKAVQTAKNIMMSAAAREVMDDAHFDPSREMIDASLKRGIHGSKRHVATSGFRGTAYAVYQPREHLRFLGAAPKARVAPVAARILRQALMVKFDESKVKRDEDGKFTFKDAAAASASGVAATAAAVVGAREGVKAKVAMDRRAFLRRARDFYGRFNERGGRPVFRGAPVMDPSPVPQKHNAVYVTSSRRAARVYADAVGGGTSGVLVVDKNNPGRVSSYILSRDTKTAHILDDPVAFAAAQSKFARDIAAGRASVGIAAPAGTAIDKTMELLRGIGRDDFLDRKLIRAAQWMPDKKMIAHLSSAGISGTYAKDFVGREFALYNTRGLRFLGEALVAPKRPSGWARALRTALRVR